jgi:hypothetical protein
VEDRSSEAAAHDHPGDGGGGGIEYSVYTINSANDGGVDRADGAATKRPITATVVEIRYFFSPFFDQSKAT